MSFKPNSELQKISENQPEEFQPHLLSNNKLAEIIVTNRYLGIMQSEAKSAMEELALRRKNGDVFPYEDKIDELMKDLPKIDLDLNNILKSFKIPL